MTTENKVSGITSWTPEQEAKITEYQEKGGLSRGEAVRKLRSEELKAKVAKRAETKPKAEPKAKPAKAPKVKKEKVPKRKAKYDAALVIKLWEAGARPVEIKNSDKLGIKGISSPFVSRILFGTTYENGQTAEQKARHKEELRRRTTEREKAKVAK